MRFALLLALCSRPAASGLEPGAAISSLALAGGFIGFAADRNLNLILSAVILDVLSLPPYAEMSSDGCPSKPTSLRALRERRRSAIYFDSTLLAVSFAGSGAMALGARTSEAKIALAGCAAVPLLFTLANLALGNFSPVRATDAALHF
jgi:hypothetical protein